MSDLIALLERIEEKSSVLYQNLPDIDLYMDQVIAYLPRQNVSEQSGETLTAAMVNNYIKDGVLPRAVDKKYNRDHLAYLIMISRLKQVLSVKDTALLLNEETKSTPVCDYFDQFQATLKELAQNLSFSSLDEENLPDLAVRLALTGYINRLACEAVLSKIKESLPPQEEPKKAPKDAK